jgi:hypothetical protein
VRSPACPADAAPSPRPPERAARPDSVRPRRRRCGFDGFDSAGDFLFAAAFGFAAGLAARFGFAARRRFAAGFALRARTPSREWRMMDFGFFAPAFFLEAGRARLFMTASLDEGS